jgi:oligogalacturonide lyase
MNRFSRRSFLGGLASLAAAQTRPAGGKRAKVESVSAVFRDPLTERLTWRLTDPDILHHMPHYHQRFLSKRGGFMLVASARTGRRQIYRMNLPEPDMVQLTDGPGVHPYSPTLDRKERHFFVLQGDELKRLSVKNGKERRIYRAEEGWILTGHLAVSDGDRHAVLVEMKAEDRVAGFEAQFARRPRCRLRVVDIRRGRSQTLVEERNWLAHPQFRPGATDVLYCHEGPWDKVDARLWLVSLDGRKIKNLRPRQADEELGHEYWSGFTNEVCYVFYPDHSGRNATIRCVNVDSGKERILSRCTKFGWLMGNRDNSAIVGAGRSLAGPNIYVLFPRLGREITICQHDSGAKPHTIAGENTEDHFAAWPEPVFSFDSRWVYYVTDRRGLPAIYRVDVSDLVEETKQERT